MNPLVFFRAGEDTKKLEQLLVHRCKSLLVACLQHCFKADLLEGGGIIYAVDIKRALFRVVFFSLSTNIVEGNRGEKCGGTVYVEVDNTAKLAVFQQMMINELLNLLLM